MNQKELLDNLSSHLKNAIARAISLATTMKHAQVTPTHVLLALFEEKGSVALEILTKAKINKEYINYLLAQLPQTNLTSEPITTALLPSLDEMSKQALEKAMLLAYEREHNYVGTEHLLYGIFKLKDKDVLGILYNAKISSKEILDQIEIVLNSTSHFPDLDDMSETMDQIQMMIDSQPPMPLPGLPSAMPTGDISPKKLPKKKMPTALEIFTVNLTEKNRQHEIDPVIGREKEIDRLINILCRRTKNNPVLVGEPGVGKTAIVEGLAKRIAEGRVPDILRRKKLFSLDLTLMISGTIYRGEFEARLKQLIDEFSSQPDYILFIDELHNIIGAGSNQGTMDAANILKPALARGKLHCIGATTIDEYKKYISGDPALERRFQPIQVNEPSAEETVNILQGIKKYYEDFHNTIITTDAIETAVALSTKYIHDYFLPDKAIDLIDEAASAVRVKQKTDVGNRKIFEMEEKLAEIQDAKEEAIASELFQEAMKLKDEEIKLEENLKKIKTALKKQKPNRQTRSRVTKKDIAAVLGAKIQIDPEMLLADEWDRLATLPERIKKQLVGQDAVVEQVTQALKQAQLGINRDHRPLASFLFAGPSGVGKTELAKILAKELYFDSAALVKLDMSEFSESHGVSKLLGSPAGYIGFKERNKFLDTLKSRPYCVVLFDEFDKAHPDVKKLLFQILEEGEMTDSAGKKISFRHAIVILTTNLGAELFKSAGIGFGLEAKTKDTPERKELLAVVMSKLKEELGVALVGRIKTICVFEPLGLKDMETIIFNYIDRLSHALNVERKLSIVADTKAVQALAHETHDADAGARNMEYVVEKILHELIIPEIQKKSAKRNYKLTKVNSSYKLI